MKNLLNKKCTDEKKINYFIQKQNNNKKKSNEQNKEQKMKPCRDLV